jgi:hypothetical protein
VVPFGGVAALQRLAPRRLAPRAVRVSRLRQSRSGRRYQERKRKQYLAATNHRRLLANCRVTIPWPECLRFDKDQRWRLSLGLPLGPVAGLALLLRCKEKPPIVDRVFQPVRRHVDRDHVAGLLFAKGLHLALRQQRAVDLLLDLVELGVLVLARMRPPSAWSASSACSRVSGSPARRNSRPPPVPKRAHRRSSAPGR